MNLSPFKEITELGGAGPACGRQNLPANPARLAGRS
jgi:hypothetical protein